MTMGAITKLAMEVENLLNLRNPSGSTGIGHLTSTVSETLINMQQYLDSIGRGIEIVESVGDLLALSVNNPTQQHAITLGHTEFGDKGGGLWVFVGDDLSASVAADPKRGLYVAPASDPTGASGAWTRVLSGSEVMPEWWGEHTAPRYSDSAEQGVSLRKNRSGASQDNWILQFGDSHSWGQGATESEQWWTALDTSIYSSNIHSLGYMARLRDDITKRRRFHTFTYGANLPVAQNTVIAPGFYGSDWLERSLKDPNGNLPLLPITGEIILNQAALTAPQTTANTAVKFYSPVARNAAYAIPFREKLARGLFGAHINVLRKEPISTFRTGGKDVFIELNVNFQNAGDAVNYTQAKSAGGGIIGERLTATGAVFLSTTQTEFPAWVAINSFVIIPGAGKVKIVSMPAIPGGTVLELRDEAGGFLPATFMRSLVDRMRLYHPHYADRAVYRVPLQGPTRSMYVAVRHKAGGGTLNAYFVDNIQTGGAGGPVLGRNGTPSVKANAWEWKGSPTTLTAHRVMPDGTWVTTASASFAADRAIINTGELSAGVIEEVVYRLDFGTVQHGDFYLELASGSDAEIRGLIADNNKIVNCSIGGRTVGQWLGGVGEEDRVAQILQHVPVQPSHIITQIPFVNEYLLQTSIVDFKVNLLAFINRFRNHMPAQANYNAQGVDFLFFTSLRDREIAFQGEASSAVTYDMYVTAAREVCEAEGCVFIDAEAALFTKVRSGYVDYERLYSDSIHPSDYANELIYAEVQKYVAQLV